MYLQVISFLLFLFCLCVALSTRHHKCAGKAGNSRKQQFIKLIRLHPEDVKNVFWKVLISKILDETHLFFFPELTMEVAKQ